MKKFFVIVTVSLFMSAVCAPVIVSAQDPQKKECCKAAEKCDKKDAKKECSKETQKSEKKSSKEVKTAEKKKK